MRISKAQTSNDDVFWDRVERRMKLKRPQFYTLTSWLLRLGMLIVLLTVTYLVLGNLFSPAKGYFISSLEILVHPIMWALLGVLCIITAAYLRFRAMGPIMDEVRNNPDL